MRRLPLDCETPAAGSSLSVHDAGELERLLRAIADRHRLRILNMLVRAGAAVCVCEFTSALGLPQQNVSYHLKQLVDAGVLLRERRRYRAGGRMNRPLARSLVGTRSGPSRSSSPAAAR